MMADLNQPINCQLFKTLEDLRNNFGKNNPSYSGDSCTGCANLKYMDGLMTCKYIFESLEKGGIE